MKRRNFIKIGAAVAALIAMPFKTILANTGPSKNIIKYIYHPGIIYAYNLLAGHKDNKAVYVRRHSLMKANNGVTYQDIVDELTKNWDNDEYLIQTASMSGFYDADKTEQFCANCKIKDAKEAFGFIDKQSGKQINDRTQSINSFAVNAMIQREAHNQIYYAFEEMAIANAMDDDKEYKRWKGIADKIGYVNHKGRETPILFAMNEKNQVYKYFMDFDKKDNKLNKNYTKVVLEILT